MCETIKLKWLVRPSSHHQYCKKCQMRALACDAAIFIICLTTICGPVCLFSYNERRRYCTLFFSSFSSLFHINSWGRRDSGWVTGVKCLHPTNWVLRCSHYVLMCWLSWQDVERRVSVSLGGGLPSQGPLFKTVFQHLWAWNHWMFLKQHYAAISILCDRWCKNKSLVSVTIL